SASQWSLQPSPLCSLPSSHPPAPASSPSVIPSPQIAEHAPVLSPVHCQPTSTKQVGLQPSSGTSLPSSQSSDSCRVPSPQVPVGEAGGGTRSFSSGVESLPDGGVPLSEPLSASGSSRAAVGVGTPASLGRFRKVG